MIRYGEHTADLEVFVSAASFEELLAEAARALTQAVADDIRVESERRLKLKGDEEDRLMQLLEELVFLQSEGFFVKEIETVGGELVLRGGPGRQKDEIKAVTWHEFWVRKNKKGFEAHFICDL